MHYNQMNYINKDSEQNSKSVFMKTNIINQISNKDTQKNNSNNYRINKVAENNKVSNSSLKSNLHQKNIHIIHLKVIEIIEIINQWTI